MWRPTDPHVLARIICEEKQKFIRRANRVFAPDALFLQMKKDQLIERYTLVICRVPATMKRANLDEMRQLCPMLECETVIQLRKMAQQYGIKGYYKYTKNQLIDAIHLKQTYNPLV